MTTRHVLYVDMTSPECKQLSDALLEKGLGFATIPVQTSIPRLSHRRMTVVGTTEILEYLDSLRGETGVLSEYP